MKELLWLIPSAPLLGALIIALISGLPTRVYGYIATLSVFVSALVVASLWYNGIWHEPVTQHIYSWLSVGDWQTAINFRIDRFSLIMVSVTSWVGFLIHLYSNQYMENKDGGRRYFAYLNLFVGGMLLFVTSDNLILLYAGWEIMGLCSYALISHYYGKEKNVYAGRKAFVTTRIGDTALALGIFLCFYQFHSVSMQDIFSGAAQANPTILAAICILFMIGAFAKSAQFPLHLWLPDAMAGPATVSALIHAATMVTAGVYLIARTHVLFDLVPDVRWWVALVGSVTLVYAAISALGQNDLKRILAYSTISQLGYMFAAVGIGAYSLALFHLAVHAAFKALLFMGSGAIIDMYGGQSDVRKMGGLYRKQPLLGLCYLAASLALAALPLVTASFYSKDAIIAADFAAPHGGLLATLGLIGAVLTGIYSMRMYFMVFTGKARSEIKPFKMRWGMKLPLIILAIASIGIGFIQMPEGWPGPHLLLHFIDPVLGTPRMPGHISDTILEVIGAIASIVGIWLAWPLVKRELKGRGTGDIKALSKGLYWDDLCQLVFVRPFVMLCDALQLVIEKVVLNSVLSNGVRQLLSVSSGAVSAAQGNFVVRYLMFMVVGVILILGYLALA
ncbi:NADH-quinone oxidoreductase subunit L [Dongshaea marina]|uniref:NADH-quinone oxidoreductase subunit L n=1 Tax=Dongshaea marina TaxID=2047966 RepID=UPI000D3E0AFB|nr:NADH-quinone oxidoreductase subunit L [Dongshaea marina]